MSQTSKEAAEIRRIESQIVEDDCRLRPWKRRNASHLSSDCSSLKVSESDLQIEIKPSNVQDESLYKGTLGKRLEDALAAEQFDLAEHLSDCISKRDLKQAIGNKQLQLENQKQSTQSGPSRHRPFWTFESKERWESKANM